LSKIKFIPSPINGISNHYKFILIANTNINEFSSIKTRTSQVYEYALGQDPENIVKRHICLPTWYMLDDKTVSEVLDQINKFKF
jgi:dTDP-4-amino-4,6-dideoxygalactose transaminase